VAYRSSDLSSAGSYFERAGLTGRWSRGARCNTGQPFVASGLRQVRVDFAVL